jgi:hypothetical protein
MNIQQTTHQLENTNENLACAIQKENFKNSKNQVSPFC